MCWKSLIAFFGCVQLDCKEEDNFRNYIKKLTAVVDIVDYDGNAFTTDTAVSSTQTIYSSWLKDVAFNHLMPTSGYQSGVTSANSIQECGILCLQKGACLSFFYASSPNSVCQMHNVVLNTTTGLNSVPSSEYFFRHAPPFTCPPDDAAYRTVRLIDGNFFTYKVYKTPHVTKAMALSNCLADGAHLLRASTLTKMDVVWELVRNCPGYDAQSYYWYDITNINAVDHLNTTQWVWSNGIPLTNPEIYWDNYPSDEPCCGDYQHCAAMYKGVQYRLYTRECLVGYTYSYICEMDHPIL